MVIGRGDAEGCWATEDIENKHRTTRASRRTRFMDDCSRKIRRTKECAGESITGKPALDASGAPLAAAALGVKIEQHIGSRPYSFPSTFHTKRESSEADILAAGCGDVFHGVRRHIRNRRDYSRRGVWAWNFGSVVFAGALEPADSVHDRRTLKRTAPRRRILRVGATRAWKFLGIPGSVAVAGGQRFGHGQLPDSVRDLFEADGAVVW